MLDDRGGMIDGGLRSAPGSAVETAQQELVRNLSAAEGVPWTADRRPTERPDWWEADLRPVDA